MDVAKRVEQLRRRIDYHNWRYYVLNEPVISDYEYDQLMKELIGLEHSYPELITFDSPTQRIGEELTEGFASVGHTVEMLSLDNTYSYDQLRDLNQRISKSLDVDQVEYVVELKIDGVAVALRYEEGIFVQGSTRGDGRTGDDITRNLKTIRAIPMRLLENLKGLMDIEVRGEVYMPIRELKEMNRLREDSNLPAFANPRNAAAGSLKLLIPKEVAKRHLDIFIHTVADPSVEDYPTHHSLLNRLKDVGLKVIPHSRLCEGIEAVIDYCDEWVDRKEALEYEVDGMVVKVNRFDYQRRLGQTIKSPRWSIAYKFPAKQATTVLKDVMLQVGRTGAITPVAVFDPVLLSGSTVSRATLHNFDEIERKDIRLGDTVLIEKGGEVIPKVVKVITEKRTGREKTIEPPSRCPVCGGKVVKLHEEVARRCINVACTSQVKRTIEHYASRQAMNIDGLGTVLVDQLVNEKLVKDYGDLYFLKEEDLLSLQKVGGKSARNLLRSIEESKQRPVYRLFFSIGIRHVGKNAARLLAEEFGSVDSLAKAAADKIAEIAGIGPTIAESVVHFFRNSRNKEVLKKLRKAGVQLKEKPRKKGGQVFSGKTVVLTGTLNGFTREEATELVLALGGKTSSSVSNKTDFVIAGRDPGSKYDKAIKLGVKIITEREFANMIGQK